VTILIQQLDLGNDALSELDLVNNQQLHSLDSRHLDFGDGAATFCNLEEMPKFVRIPEVGIS
jgi:hypothetical protein